MTSFKANDIQMIALLVGNPDLARQVREGEVKGILLPGSKRSALVPDVPTFAESGLDARTRPPLRPGSACSRPRARRSRYVDKLNTEFNAIMAMPEFRERFLTSKGFTPAGTKPDVFAKFLVEDRKVAAELVALSGVKLEE